MNENHLDRLRSCSAWRSAFEIHAEALVRFHELCAETLESSCPLRPLAPRTLSMEANLFSTLFIMAARGLGLSDEKVRFYAVVNQCLRALVTGCDNILDNEYKEVIPFELPGNGTRFRSVLKIMTGDAVLARLIVKEVAAGRLSEEKAARLFKTVLGVLVPSGIQEHEEESRQNWEVPPPSKMLEDVLYRKTGLLFQAPLRLIEQVGDATPEQVKAPALALSNFGIACQILDDAMDIVEDLTLRRLNLVHSLAIHGSDPVESALAKAVCWEEHISEDEAANVATQLPLAAAQCKTLAAEYFIRAYQGIRLVLPDFDRDAMEALGTMVQKAIMKSRFSAPLGQLV